MAEITSVDFHDAVAQSFRDFVTAHVGAEAPFPAIQFPNEDLTKEGLEEWVRLYILGAPEGAERWSNSVSRDRYLESGVITIEVYVRQGSSSRRAYRLIEIAKRWMRNAKLPQTVLTEVTTPQEDGADGLTWFQVSIQCNFRYLSDVAAID